jgi:hypothetical protein
VTPALKAVASVEAARTATVLAAETCAQEAIMTQCSAVILIKDAEDRAALVEREAQEMVSRVEAESIMTLAPAHVEAKCLIQKIALLKGELSEGHRAQDVAEVNSCGLYDVAADADWR